MKRLLLGIALSVAVTSSHAIVVANAGGSKPSPETRETASTVVNLPGVCMVKVGVNNTYINAYSVVSVYPVEPNRVRIIRVTDVENYRNMTPGLLLTVAEGSAFAHVDRLVKLFEACGRR